MIEPGLEMRAMPRILPLFLLLCAAPPAAGADADAFLTEGKVGLDLRYRYEAVDQSDKPAEANASTLRLRLDLSSGVVHGFSALAQFDHVEAIGNARYDDTRNGLSQYPVVADPEGSDLNQAWLQYQDAAGTLIRAGRQKILIGNERFIGPVGWRQNEQTFDALRVDVHAVPHTAITYAYVDRVLRVFGPDDGVPPSELDADSHILDARITALPVGALALYGFHLDFRNAPQLSSDTLGARWDGDHALEGELKLLWALEYAMQSDTGANQADIDAHYELAEIKLQFPGAGVAVGREVLSGERGTFTSSTNPAFQTPLATLHPFQGWADKFTTTPSAGVVDVYFGGSLKFRGWTGQAVWHEFGAEATNARYGTEIDFAVSRQFAERYDLLLKYADYSADELFTDTRKFWVQLAAKF